MTFDPVSLQITKLCSGFVMDRLVGNTRGLCGVQAAAVVAGAPPSDWEVYPPYFTVSRIFRWPVAPLDGVDNTSMRKLSPIPNSVMKQLAKGVYNSQYGVKDTTQLSSKFSCCGQYDGPLNKDTYLNNQRKVFSGDFDKCFAVEDSKFEYTRIDPYEPNRVWADSLIIAKHIGKFMDQDATGITWESAPEAVSFTFDDNGLCTRVTYGYVMDPTVGKLNTLPINE